MRRILYCLLFLMLFSVISFAVPGQIAFQGVLKDSAGNLISGSRSVIFYIFPNPTGAGALWSETQTVSVEAGLYNVQLGSVTPITSTVFSDGLLKYLAISIDGNELLPRIVLLTVPYAYRAAYADTAGTSGGTQNAVLFNPPTRQSTSAASAIWISSSAGGSDLSTTVAVISTETTGTFSAAIGGLANNPLTTNYGVAGLSNGNPGYAVAGRYMGTGLGYGVYGQLMGTTTTGYGVYGYSSKAVGVGGSGKTAGGSFEATGDDSIAVSGTSLGTNGEEIGVLGTAITGVKGLSTNGTGVIGYATNWGTGVAGISLAGRGVWGFTFATDQYSGQFAGGLGVQIITGSLEAKSGLVIDDAFTPSGSADGKGMTGNIQWDEKYIYIKTAAHGWKRATLEAF